MHTRGPSFLTYIYIHTYSSLPFPPKHAHDPAIAQANLHPWNPWRGPLPYQLARANPLFQLVESTRIGGGRLRRSVHDRTTGGRNWIFRRRTPPSSPLFDFFRYVAIFFFFFARREKQRCRPGRVIYRGDRRFRYDTNRAVRGKCGRIDDSPVITKRNVPSLPFISRSFLKLELDGHLPRRY